MNHSTDATTTEEESVLEQRSFADVSMEIVQDSFVRFECQSKAKSVWNFREGGIRFVLSSLLHSEPYGNATGIGQVLALTCQLPFLHDLYTPQNIAVCLSNLYHE